METKANSQVGQGAALFLDHKLRQAGACYESSIALPGQAETAREALECLERVSWEWLDVFAVAATSDARAVIPRLCMDLQGVFSALVRGVLTGTQPRCVGTVDDGWQLQEAARAVMLDESCWDNEQRGSAARTLLKASGCGQKQSGRNPGPEDCRSEVFATG